MLTCGRSFDVKAAHKIAAVSRCVKQHKSRNDRDAEARRLLALVGLEGEVVARTPRLKESASSQRMSGATKGGRSGNQVVYLIVSGMGFGYEKTP